MKSGSYPQLSVILASAGIAGIRLFTLLESTGPRNLPKVFAIRSSTSKSLYDPGYVKNSPVSCASSIVSERRNVSSMMFLIKIILCLPTL